MFLFKQMERDRSQLILLTFKELNIQYNSCHRRTAQPPLAFSRVKVFFKDEPGEGSGVARSFYTAIADAFLANEKLPNLDSVQISVLDRMRNSDVLPRTVSIDSVVLFFVTQVSTVMKDYFYDFSLYRFLTFDQFDSISTDYYIDKFM